MPPGFASRRPWSLLSVLASLRQVFHFGSTFGVGKCDGTAGNPKSSCLDVLTRDIADMVSRSLASPSALKVNGKPVLLIYTDAASTYAQPADWQVSDCSGTVSERKSDRVAQVIFANASAIAGTDFYNIGTTSSAAFFAVSPLGAVLVHDTRVCHAQAFDVLASWVNLGWWSGTSGSTVYQHATNWIQSEHSALLRFAIILCLLACLLRFAC